MIDGVREPRLEDFGITEGDLARVPCAFLSDHRLGALTVAYLVAAVAVFVTILRASGSYSASVFFTIVSLAAGSVLLLPALIFLLCVSERAEERWLCSRFPKLNACLAYRRALAEHGRAVRSMTASNSTTPQWSVLSRPAMVEAVQARLVQLLQVPAIELDMERDGADLAVQPPGSRVLVRCEPGPGPVGAGVGREVVAAVMDHGARGALIVSSGTATPALEHYLEGRPIRMVPPWQLDGVFDGVELGASSS
ncbi:MAG: hypothetical protein PVG92_02605 [Holophagae bacterium]